MTKSVKIVFLAVLSVAVVSAMSMFAGCGGGGGSSTPAGPPTLHTITVTPGVVSMSTATTKQFAATALMSDNTPTTVPITWASSNTGVATISASGLATPVNLGSTTITASSGSVSGTATLTVAPAVYSGTLYMASEMGGHIGIYNVTIDPSQATPITITNGSGSGTIKQLSGSPGQTITHIFHDVRYDAANNRVWYSTIIPDAALDPNSPNLNTARVGYMDLANNNAVNDATVDVDATASATIMNLVFSGDHNTAVVGLPLVYCASGQTDNYYVAFSMTLPAYIDVFPKSAITNGADLSASRTRTYVSAFRPDDLGGTMAGPISLFTHGNVSPDGTETYVVVNEVNVTDANIPAGDPKGAFTGYLIKTSDLISGTVSTASIDAENTVTGLAGTTTDAPSVAFRASYTPDGSKILQATKDRFVVLNGTTLAAENGASGDTSVGDPADNTKIENHDAMSTPDGRYAILALRYADSTTNGHQTSGLQLYDLNTMQPVGKVTATCSACHAAMGTLTTDDHPTCGVDGHLTAQ